MVTRLLQSMNTYINDNNYSKAFTNIHKYEAIHITMKQKVFLAMGDWVLANIMWYMFWIQRGVHDVGPNKYVPGSEGSSETYLDHVSSPSG